MKVDCFFYKDLGSTYTTSQMLGIIQMFQYFLYIYAHQGYIYLGRKQYYNDILQFKKLFCILIYFRI